MGFRCLHKSNKYKCIFCIYLLSKRKERVHPEDHLVSRYSIDGAGSSPGERARESDRYAGKTQVGHTGRFSSERHLRDSSVVPQNGRSSHLRPSRNVDGDRWRYSGPIGLAEPSRLVSRPHSRWQTAESVSETFVRGPLEGRKWSSVHNPRECSRECSRVAATHPRSSADLSRICRERIFHSC